MAIMITDERMTSAATRHRAEPDGDGWRVSWLPGRTLTRNEAVTAMMLATVVAGGIGDHTDPRWPHLEGWAGELGLSGAAAVGMASTVLP